MTVRVHVRWVPVEPGATDVHALLPLLSDDERARCAATADAAAATRFVIGRVALRMLVAELLTEKARSRDDAAVEVSPADILVTAICAECGGPHGRPMVEAPSRKGKPLSVSIAHCRSGVAVAASWNGSIGVDVEVADVAPETLESICALVPPASRPAGRRWEPVQHWTRVEAVLKADGRGLLVDPAEVKVEAHDGLVTADLTTRYVLAELRVDPEVRGSVAIEVREGKKATAPLVGWRRLELEQLQVAAPQLS